METSIANPFGVTPTPRFLEAVQDIAQAVGCDAARVAEGQSVRHHGLDFRIRHHGALDPAGMVLTIDLGPISSDRKASYYEALLKQHFTTPAGVAGYYAMQPDTGRLAYCLRIDLEKTDKVAHATLSFVELTAVSREKLAAVFEEAICLRMHNPAATPHDGWAPNRCV